MLHKVPDTAGTGIGTMGHSTSPRMTHAAITFRAKKKTFWSTNFHNRTRRGEHHCSLAHHRLAQRYRRQHLHQAYGQRRTNLEHSILKLATRPSHRRHYHAYEFLNDYREWNLLQQMKTPCKHPRQRHHHHLHHHRVIIIIVSGRLWQLQHRQVQ